MNTIKDKRSLLAAFILTAALAASILPQIAAARPTSKRSGVVGTSSMLTNSFTHEGQTNDQRRSSAQLKRSYDRGVRYFQSGQYKKAGHSFRVVLRARPSDAAANFYMARINAKLDNHSLAIENYASALDQYPDNYAMTAGIAQSYIALAQYGDAMRVLARLESAADKCGSVCDDTNTIQFSVEIVKQAI